MSLISTEIAKELAIVAKSNFVKEYGWWYRQIETQYKVYQTIAPSALTIVRARQYSQLSAAEIEELKVFFKHLYANHAYGSVGQGKVAAQTVFNNLTIFFDCTQKLDTAVNQGKNLGDIFNSAAIILNNRGYHAVKQRAISIMMGLSIPSLFNYADYARIASYLGINPQAFPNNLVNLATDLNSILSTAGINDSIASYIFPWVVYDYFEGEYLDRTSINEPRMFKNLHLPGYTVSSFYNSLKTKGFVILAGTSGTGKTKIVEEFVRYFEYKSEVLTDSSGLIKIKTSKSYFEYYFCNILVQYWREDLRLVPDLEVGESLSITLFANGKQYPANMYRRPSFMRITGLSNFYTDSNSPKEFYLKPHLQADGKFLGYDVIFTLDTSLPSKTVSNFLFFPVRPDFRDSKALFGFYNPLNSQYLGTRLLDFITSATENYIERGQKASPFFVLLDEMNLARVEHYFSDVLSVMESKKISKADIDEDNIPESLLAVTDGNKNSAIGFSGAAVMLHHADGLVNVPAQLHLPPNLYFIGTVNIDETSYVFSPKVLDRAFTIEFDVDSFENYIHRSKQTGNNPPIKGVETDFINNGSFTKFNPKELFQDYPASVSGWDDLMPVESLEQLNCILTKYGFGFGYRVVDEILLYLSNCRKSPDAIKNLSSEYENFDLAIKMKILPKFHGTRQKLEAAIIEVLTDFADVEVSGNKTLEDILREIGEFGVPKLKREQADHILSFGDYMLTTSYPHTAKKLFELFYKLQINGFASFI